MAFENVRLPLNCHELRTSTADSIAINEWTSLKTSIFYGLRLIDFNPFWFLFPVHKVHVVVPLLLLYTYKNKLLLAKETDR